MKREKKVGANLAKVDLRERRSLLLVVGLWLFAVAAAYAGPMENPLTRAAYFGDLSVAQELVAGGINVNSRDSRGMTPLMWAAYKGRTAMVQWLIDQGADVRAVSDRGLTALQAAVKGNHSEIATFIEGRQKLIAAR